MLAFYAARADHLEARIRPAVANGTWVLCDRFADSTRAYQGVAGGVDAAAVEAIDRLVVGATQPDLTLLLDAPVELGMARAGVRNGHDEPDRFESERTEFFERVRQCYLARAAREPARFRVIDAGGSPAQVEQAVRDAMGPLLAASGKP